MTPKQVIRRVLMKTRFRDPENMADPIVAALRAAGLLPGPDDIVVSREALVHYVKHAADPDTFYPPDPQDCQDCAPVAAALSQSQPYPEETP